MHKRITLKEIYTFPISKNISNITSALWTRNNNTSNIKTVIKDPRKILSKRGGHKIPSFQLLFQRRNAFLSYCFQFRANSRYRWKRGREIEQKGIGQPLFVYQLDEYSSLLNTGHPDPFNSINSRLYTR